MTTILFSPELDIHQSGFPQTSSFAPLNSHVQAREGVTNSRLEGKVLRLRGGSHLLKVTEAARGRRDSPTSNGVSRP